MLPGSGIGPELMGYIKEVFRYAGAPVDFQTVEIDPSSDEKNELEYAITSIKRNGVAIKGTALELDLHLKNRVKQIQYLIIIFLEHYFIY